MANCFLSFIEAINSLNAIDTILKRSVTGLNGITTKMSKLFLCFKNERHDTVLTVYYGCNT